MNRRKGSQWNLLPLKKNKHHKYASMNRENSNKLRNRNLIRKAIFRKSGIEQYYTFRVLHCASLRGKLRQEHHLGQEFKTKLGTIAIACLEKGVLNSDNKVHHTQTGEMALAVQAWRSVLDPRDPGEVEGENQLPRVVLWSLCTHCGVCGCPIMHSYIHSKYLRRKKILNIFK